MKKRIILLTILFVIGYGACWLFYPKFTYVFYNYEVGEYKSDVLNLSCDFHPNYQPTRDNKLSIRSSPYDIWLSFKVADNSLISITKLTLIADQNVVYSSNDVVTEYLQKEKWQDILYKNDVCLEYLDYTVVLEYIKDVNGKKELGIVETLLKREYVEKKYSMFDEMMGI